MNENCYFAIEKMLYKLPRLALLDTPSKFEGDISPLHYTLRQLKLTAIKIDCN